MANASDFGINVNTTYVWEVSQLYHIDVNSEEFKQLLVRLYQNLNRISLALNAKESGMYPLQEFVTGQQFFPNPALGSETDQFPILRPVFRTTINFGALPNTGTKSVAHGITMNKNVTVTHVYGAATDTTGLNYIPLPYASPTLVSNIELKLDATNVTIITGSNRSNFNITYVVIEYMKQ